MKEPTWLEVALNGPWSRARQPNIPVSADEIVEAALGCASEGASIIHFHAYDPASGRQRDGLLALEQPGAPWMVAGLGVELGSLIGAAVERGGHVRVGLEDAPMGFESDNLSLVRRARRRIEQAGGELANASQVRQRLRRDTSAKV